MATEHQKEEPSYSGLVFNSDGSVTRLPSPIFPDVSATSDHDPLTGVASRDIILNPDLNLWVRLFLPTNISSSVQSEKQLIPIIIYFHGGGFTLLSAATAQMHTLCTQIASKIPSIVISVNYRLAPEHRLPAAYEDGYSVLLWLDKMNNASAAAAGTESDSSWVSSADFSNIFVAGDSAGGNLAHHVAVRGSELHESKQLSFKLAGQILLQPFFGGVERSESEVTLGKGPVITNQNCDFCWKCALPEGADRDHPFCNPMKCELREVMKKLGEGKFVARTMVVAGGMDLLKDRQVEYARVLEECGKSVKLLVYPSAVHGFYVFPGSPETPLLLDEMAAFCASA